MGWPRVNTHPSGPLPAERQVGEPGGVPRVTRTPPSSPGHQRVTKHHRRNNPTRSQAIKPPTLAPPGRDRVFGPVRSAPIIGELERNLIEYRVAPTAVARLTTLMSDTFPDASVIAYEDLIRRSPCHEKDRHVLAAALRSCAAAVVTFNLRDFPAKSTEPLRDRRG